MMAMSSTSESILVPAGSESITSSSIRVLKRSMLTMLPWGVPLSKDSSWEVALEGNPRPSIREKVFHPLKNPAADSLAWAARIALPFATSKAFFRSRKVTTAFLPDMVMSMSCRQSRVPVFRVYAIMLLWSGPAAHCNLFRTIFCAVLPSQLSSEMGLFFQDSFGLGMVWIIASLQAVGRRPAT